VSTFRSKFNFSRKKAPNQANPIRGILFYHAMQCLGAVLTAHYCLPMLVIPHYSAYSIQTDGYRRASVYAILSSHVRFGVITRHYNSSISVGIISLLHLCSHHRSAVC
jgi:hypothetical protein